MTGARSPKRRRIGLDCREAFRERPRGIGLYCRHLMRELAELEPEFDFELYHERERPRDLLPTPSWMRSNHLVMRGSRFHLWERVALPMRLLSDGVDLYHGTYNTLPPRPPLLRGPKLAVTLHDVIVTWWDDDHRDPFVRYARRVTDRVVRQADAIVTVSEFSRRDILDRFDVAPEKVHVVHNGIHPIYLADAADGTAEAVQAKFADGRPYVFAIGAELRRKNTDALFPAWRRLRDNAAVRDELLIVTGLQGRALQARKSAAERAGVLDGVRLLGYQTLDDLRALYTGARLFVYPSLVEGWGIPVVESLACGTPVCTSNTAAMPEAGGEHAYYFDPRNSDSIVATIEEALHRDSFSKIRAQAQARARSFTWRRHAERLVELWQTILP